MAVIKEIFWPHIYILIFFFICNSLAMYLDPEGWEGFVIVDNYLIWDALYYTIISHTTVGYGDILPKWRYWKMLGATHSLIVFFVIINEISDINIFKTKKNTIKLEDNEDNNKLERQNCDIYIVKK